MKKETKRNASNKELFAQANSVKVENAFIYAIFNSLKKETKDVNNRVINKDLSFELKRISKNIEIINLIGGLKNDDVIKLISNGVKFNESQVTKLALNYDDLDNTIKTDERAKLINENIFLPLRKDEINQNLAFQYFVKMLKFNYKFDFKCTSLQIAKLILNLCPKFFKDNNLIEFFKPVEFETCIDELNNYLINTYKITLVEFYKITNATNENLTLKQIITLEKSKIKAMQTLEKTLSKVGLSLDDIKTKEIETSNTTN
jgi:hypothetical protein